MSIGDHKHNGEAEQGHTEGRKIGLSGTATQVEPNDTPREANAPESEGEPQLPYGSLTAHHRQSLRDSGISDDVIESRGYCSTAATAQWKDALSELGIQVALTRAAGILIPIRDIWGRIVYHQFRPDDPPRDSNGKVRKYVDPTGASKVLDIPAGCAERLRDPSIPLWITEGAKKVDAGVSAGLTIVGVLGVHCFDTPGVSWAGVVLDNRLVYICYDSDAADNQQVQSAERKLTTFLRERGAEVKVLRIHPFPDGEKCGLDDYLAAGYDPDDLIRRAQRSDAEAMPDIDDVLVHAMDVEEERYSWLWPGRIPFGKFTLLEGDPGLGKSVLTIDLAARITTGTAMPDGTQSTDFTGPQNVLLLATEDDLADTVLPRFRIAGGDRTRLSALKATYKTSRGIRLINLVDSLPLIQQVVAREQIKLIIIDPVMQYLPGKVDSYKEQDIRLGLTPLVEFAQEAGIAVVGLRHLRKTKAGEGGNPIYAGGGSIALSALARAIMVAGPDPEDESGGQFLLASTKINIAQRPPSLRYSLADVDGYPRVRWGETSPITAQQLLNGGGGDTAAVKEAKQFIISMIEEGVVRAKEIEALARDAGITRSTLHRAKRQLDIQSQRIGSGPGSHVEWRFPVNVSHLTDNVP